jgi:hypothetical protein
MNSHRLTGLDAQNPLAFFAALGLLRVLEDIAVKAGDSVPTLCFVDRLGQTPILNSTLTMDEIVAAVCQDAEEQQSNPALKLAYDENGQAVDCAAAVAIRDLKPSPDLAAQFLREMSTNSKRVAALAAGLFSELVQDNNGNSKPTGLHFTAGQQSFLAMVDDLRSGINVDNVREALLGPWTNSSMLPSLSWDASISRNYALRADNPSGEKRGSVPAANWLGVIALEFFPVSVRYRRLATTCITGGWKDSTFQWPLWSVPQTAAVIRSLLKVDASKYSSVERDAYGISAVLASKILRSDQGGYGSFSPADYVLPKSKRAEY